MIEPDPIREPDPMFDNLVLPYFKDEVIFKQRIKIKSANDFKIMERLVLCLVTHLNVYSLR